ncbi:DUF262 domain-containing protein [Prevotella stercorea]|uniref:DUF262 domain-containing protein n=1 Tax=Leyella stercorea TaxID=363265 RepID=UPI001F42354E|nr:DUF262 domain-containing protein [Leyella stercorea]MCF2578294.1 DUF262 domain-containing protein [Leyella stercorea]
MQKEEFDNNTEADFLEGETTDIGGLESVYPNAEVRVEKAQYSTMHLKRLVEERKELVIDPDFQRNDVWSAKQSAELVESILMGIPIPTIYLFEMKDGTKQVVDGRQRISAILNFLNNKFSLKDLKILPQCNGKTFSELDFKMQGIFEDYQLSFYIIQPPTPERVKYDIFDRVNRGGTRLTNQEMRNALYKGHSTVMLKDLAASSVFLNATGRGISSKRMKDQYVILRSIAFYLLKKKQHEVLEQNGETIEYKSDIDDFLAKTMIFLNEKASKELLEDCKNTFYRAMDNCYNVLGRDAFRFDSESGNRRPINMPLFEVLMYVFSDNKLMEDVDYTKKEVENFKRKFDHQQMFSGNVDSTTNLNDRYDLAEELIKQISDAIKTNNK